MANRSCDNCKHRLTDARSFPCNGCKRNFIDAWEAKQKPSNADKIRNMTDEELAEFLVNFKNTFGEEYEGEISCLEWLKAK